MTRKLIAICMCLMFLTATTAAFAEDVYITKRGKKYHKATCSFIKNSKTQEISKEEALEKGLKPCGRCYKEDLASNAANEDSKASNKLAKKSSRKKSQSSN